MTDNVSMILMGTALSIKDEEMYNVAASYLTQKFPFTFQQCRVERHPDVHNLLSMALHGALLVSNQRVNLIVAIIEYGQSRNYLMSVSHAILKYIFSEVLSGYQDFTNELIEVCKSLVTSKVIYTSASKEDLESHRSLNTM